MPTADPQAQTRTRPGVRWYAIGLALIVLGVGVFLVSLVVQRNHLAAQVAALPRLTLPAGGTVELPDAGPAVVYYEGPADPADPPLDYATLRPRLDVTRPDAPPDAPVIGVGRPATVEAYPIHGRHAYAVATFTAPAPGVYRIEGALAPDAAEARVAVGRVAVTDMMRDWTGVFGGAVVAVLGGVAGVLVLVVTLMLRTGNVTRRDD